MWVKQRWQKLRLYPHFNIFRVLITKFSIEATQSDGAFFPLNGREALAKKSFSVAGKKSGKVLAKGVGSKRALPVATESILHNLKL